MLNNSTIGRLREMKLNAFATELERQLTDSGSYAQLGFEERLGLLVDSELDRRQMNKLNRYIKNARFADPHASIEDIESVRLMIIFLLSFQ